MMKEFVNTNLSESIFLIKYITLQIPLLKTRFISQEQCDQMLIYNNDNLLQWHIKFAKEGSKFCQLLNGPSKIDIVFKNFFSKGQIFAKSGHTDQEPLQVGPQFRYELQKICEISLLTFPCPHIR